MTFENRWCEVTTPPEGESTNSVLLFYRLRGATDPAAEEEVGPYLIGWW
jgi:hypothetical protein